MILGRKFEHVLELNEDNESWSLHSYSKHVKADVENPNRLTIVQQDSVIKFPTFYKNKPITVIKSALRCYDITLYVRIHHKPKPITATSVILPEKLEKLDYPGFEHCECVKKIELPKTLNEIRSGIGGGFQWWYSLEEISLPDGMSKIESIFFNCSNLKTVSLPNSVTVIGSEAFKYCYKLKAINIPSSVKKIEKEAFASCSSLRNIVIPNSVVFIGSWAFTRCENLETLIIPDSVKDIEYYAFSECSKLTIFTSHKGFPKGWSASNPDKRMIYWRGEWGIDKKTGLPYPYEVLKKSTYVDESKFLPPREVIITDEMLEKYRGISAKELLDLFGEDE